jgi:hypothetical protein
MKKKEVGHLLKIYEKELEEIQNQNFDLLDSVEKSPFSLEKKIIESKEKKVNLRDKNYKNKLKYFFNFIYKKSSNWYKYNSIHLFLYIGTFLIISSSSNFLLKENISETIKLSILTLMMCLFFFGGFWIYKIPKIKNASFTFLTIGSILIPINTFGWYNFYFKEIGISLGVIEMIISLLCLGIYIFLGIYLKSKIFSYLASLSINFTFFLFCKFKGL